MFKSNENENTKGGNKYNEEEIFGNDNNWGNSNLEEYEVSEEEPRKIKNNGIKTKRNRKSIGTKRRY